MLTYVADVFGHALVVSPFYLPIKKYNGGSFFVKRESILNGGQLRKQTVSVYLSRAVSIYLSAIDFKQDYSEYVEIKVKIPLSTLEKAVKEASSSH